MTALLVSSAAGAQEVAVGQKLLGTIGIQGGKQASTGVYVGTRVIAYLANELVDRNGNSVPVGLDAKAFGGSLEVAATFEVKPLSTYVGAAVGVVAAHLELETETPPSSNGRSGLSDLSIQPIRLGRRFPHVDVVTNYALYVPTGTFDPRGQVGIGQGQWTHELSLGGAVYFDEERTWYLSAVGSLDVNTRKRDIDITRGTTIQVQGGFGKTLFRILDVGIASYALWQVSDDRGADVPPALVGARARAYGLGPEIDLLIPAIRGRLSARYERDVAVASRPEGQILIVGLTVAAWAPSASGQGSARPDALP